jgi:hypothetical protein
LVKELHIALTDDSTKLVDINKIGQEESNDHLPSLYPEGFSAKSFVDVIEYSKIWEVIDEN